MQKTIFGALIRKLVACLPTQHLMTIGRLRVRLLWSLEMRFGGYRDPKIGECLAG